ncbi:CUE protein [Geosmithia morbida]|uniref:CUE protein n=1 Tax=Geosmithia morbida TaxID=1094350 RepID=A0A9P4YXV3_9HYPO|nr:CUE protein [Geosmithia morbida]KAF4123746.1 CUE protein [Geosmithia morbida]
MAGSVETPTKVTADSGAESPTTARPFEMDDDDVQETSVIGSGSEAAEATAPASAPAPAAAAAANATTSTTATTPPAASAGPAAAATATSPKPASIEAGDDEVPPSKPPRPPTEAQKNEMILKEAFPGVDAPVIKAVISASGGNVERAFNALLQMTDPEAANNEPQQEQTDVPPPRPPRPQGRAEMSQLEADELYARQLAEQYDNQAGAYEARTAAANQRHREGVRAGHRRQASSYDDDGDREYSFIEDELPVIRDQLRQGFVETQTKVNGWISTLKKRIEESFDESEDPHHQQEHGQQGRYRHGGEPSNRRSGDYDADPQVLGDDFAGIRLSADGRPYRHPSTSPRSNSGRRVGFKDEPEEINMYERSPPVPPKDSSATAGGAKASKWQPLSSVEPHPIGDNDPFSLGDSDDEKDNSTTTKDAATKDVSSAAAKDSDNIERLKKAAAEAMSDNLVDDGDKTKAKTDN